MTTSPKETLLQRLRDRTARTAVVGLGYVGLPLAVELAASGFSVIGLDIDPHKVEQINQGHSYIADVPSEKLAPLVASGKLCATTNYEDLREVDTINISVPTPLTNAKEPDMSYIISAMDSIATIAHAGLLVILESTTYPGTTEEIVLPRLQARGFTAGEDIFVAFSGERIDPGNQKYTIKNTPKVVGGVTPNSTELAVALYETAIDTVVTVSSPATAEMTKLLENTFRSVNIALVNEVAIICDRLGIDAWEVIGAAATKPFGFMPFYPGPGVGGHCIPLDPHYLNWKAKEVGYPARFIDLADEINRGMPHYVVDRVTDALNDEAKAVRGATIVILGVAYKPNVDDVRESPALEVIDLLNRKGAIVKYHDPYVASIRTNTGDTMQKTPYSTDLLNAADCVLIITNHQDYNWEQVVQHSRVILDTRHAVAHLEELASQNDTRIVGL